MKNNIKKYIMIVLLLVWLPSSYVHAEHLNDDGFVDWFELMAPMDWSSATCSYTVKDISVTRTGETVTIDGGKLGKLGWAPAGVHLHNANKATTYIFKNIEIADMYIGVNDLFGDNYDYANRVYKIILEETATVYGMIDTLQTLNTTVEIENNGVIYGGDAYTTINVSLDGGSIFKLTGSGKIYSPETQNTTRDFRPPLKGHLSFGIDGISQNDQDAVEQIVDTLKNVQIDFSQFQGEPIVYVFFDRVKDFYDRECFELDVHDSAGKTVLSGLAATNDALQIVVSNQDANAVPTLQTKVYWSSDEQALCYARLVDAEEHSYGLKKKATLYIPYPTGITKENADLFEFSIEYPVLDGDKTYSSVDGTITSTAYGLAIDVDEVVPFRMCWEKMNQQPTESDDSEKGNLLPGNTNIDVLPPVKVPTIIWSSNETLPTDLVINFNKTLHTNGRRVKYDVTLVDDNGNPVELSTDCLLIFPYPDGLDMYSNRKYLIKIYHYSKQGTEVFNSENNSIMLLPQGLAIRISSFSPFVLEWTDKTVDVTPPQTGDHSQIGLWVVLLVLSGLAAITACKHKKA